MEEEIQKRISIIIPVYQEGALVDDVIKEIISKQVYNNQIIIVNGDQQGLELNSKLGFEVIQSQKGRSIQMNTGAKYATNNILFFLHADSILPQAFDKYIIDAFNEGYTCGCFKMKFDYVNPLLYLLGQLTKVKSLWCRGGDQGLFVLSSLFHDIGGFNNELLLFEDNEILKRLPFPEKFKIIPEWLTTSARKHKEIGVIKLNWLYFRLHKAYRNGATQQELLAMYNAVVN